MKEKVKQLIAEHLVRQGQLKITLHNLNVIGALTEDFENQILDEIREIEESIQKLRDILKVI